MRRTLLIALFIYSVPGLAAEDFSAAYNPISGYVEISYQLSAGPSNQLITLQRSQNQVVWKDVTSEKVIPKSSGSRVYLLHDRDPKPGTSYYRIRISGDKMKALYSSVRLVHIQEPTDDWIVYPNPVKDLLTLKYKGVTTFKGVINVTISSNSGTILLQRRFASNQRLFQIDVSGFTRGRYIIKISVAEKLVGFEPFIKG